MSYFDPCIYNSEHLTAVDRKKVEEINFLKESIFCETVVDDYLSQLVEGKYMQELTKEILLPFFEYLNNLWECGITNYIIDTIDSYSEEEFEKICAELNLKKEGTKSNENNVEE